MNLWQESHRHIAGNNGEHSRKPTEAQIELGKRRKREDRRKCANELRALRSRNADIDEFEEMANELEACHAGSE